jgi:hypothetical protein
MSRRARCPLFRPVVVVALATVVALVDGCAAGQRVPDTTARPAPATLERAAAHNDDDDAADDDDDDRPRWTWHATLRGGGDVDVGVIDVRLCFSGRPPRRVVPENPRALSFLVDAPRVVDARGAARGRLVVDTDGLVTAHLPVGACIAYAFDLERAAGQLQQLDLALRVGRAVVASPDVWLWRPRPWPQGSVGALIVDVADDAAGATLTGPFARDADGRLLVPPSTYTLQAYAAFGRLRDASLSRAGVQLRVVVAGDDGAIDDATLQRWLAVAVDDVAAPLARFPVDDAVVIAAPLWGSRPIAAGFLGRGGGRASVLLLLGRRATLGAPAPQRDDDDEADDNGRWVLTHELSHALLPPVARGDAWLNEGLATWHQEVLPVQAGRRRDDEARRQLALGFRTGALRAAQDGLSLSRACSEMDGRGSYQHCYWGGAALAALVADDVGVPAMQALVAALHASAPLDAAPRPALSILGDVAAGEGDAARAARRLVERWMEACDAPFPDVSEWLARVPGSSSSAGGSG